MRTFFALLLAAAFFAVSLPPPANADHLCVANPDNATGGLVCAPFNSAGHAAPATSDFTGCTIATPTNVLLCAARLNPMIDPWYFGITYAVFCPLNGPVQDCYLP